MSLSYNWAVNFILFFFLNLCLKEFYFCKYSFSVLWQMNTLWHLLGKPTKSYCLRTEVKIWGKSACTSIACDDFLWQPKNPSLHQCFIIKPLWHPLCIIYKIQACRCVCSGSNFHSYRSIRVKILSMMKHCSESSLAQKDLDTPVEQVECESTWECPYNKVCWLSPGLY